LKAPAKPTTSTSEDSPAETTAGEQYVRQPLFVAETPYPETPKVVCYEDTYVNHIPASRRGPESREKAAKSLNQPNAVVKGTSNPGYVAFVNSDDSSNTQGSPFVVFVDPTGRPMPTVASMGHRRDFRELHRHEVLWVRSDESNEDD
jgi:hypothetical protein